MNSRRTKISDNPAAARWRIGAVRNIRTNGSDKPLYALRKSYTITRRYVVPRSDSIPPGKPVRHLGKRVFVQMCDKQPRLARRLRLATPSAAMITDRVAGGPAERAGPGAVRSAGTVGAPPASARLLQVRAREWRAGPKNRPSRQTEIATYPSSASGDPTPKPGATIRRVLRRKPARAGEEGVRVKDRHRSRARLFAALSPGAGKCRRTSSVAKPPAPWCARVSIISKPE